MGEVYRATHTKLRRDVALKVLPGKWRQMLNPSCVGVGFYWVLVTIFGRCPAGEGVLAVAAEAQQASQPGESPFCPTTGMTTSLRLGF